MPIFNHYEPLADISTRLSLPSLVFSIVTPIVVFCRFVARSMHGGDVGADDWTILASLAFTETVNVQMIICCEWGFGKHTKLLDPHNVSRTLELYWFAQILYKIGIGLTKVSILAFYLRVFGIIRWFRISCLVVMGIVVAFTISSVMTSIFQCSPVKFAFDKSGEGACIDLTKFWFANAGYNIGTDGIIIIMPILVVKTLQFPKRTKLALFGVFALGIFVCTTSILRVTTLNVSTAHTDTMWQSISSSMWTVIESNLGIIVACMPALRRPIVRFFPLLLGKMGRTTARRSGRHQNGYPSHANPVLELEMPEKRLHSRGATSTRNRTWLDEDSLGTADAPRSSIKFLTKNPEIHDVDDMGNISDGDRGSDDHILKNSPIYSRKHNRNHITGTAENMVETSAGSSMRNPTYYPGQ